MSLQWDSWLDYSLIFIYRQWTSLERPRFIDLPALPEREREGWSVTFQNHRSLTGGRCSRNVVGDKV